MRHSKSLFRVFSFFVMLTMVMGLAVGPASAKPAAVQPDAIATVLSEGFDGVTPPALPGGWTSTITGGTNTSTAWATNAGTRWPSGGGTNTPPNVVYFNSFSVGSGNAARLAYGTPLNLAGATSASLSFWMYHDTGYSSSDDTMQVQTSTDGTTWTNLGSLYHRYTGTTGWEQITLDLTPFIAGGPFQIGFLGTSAYGNDVHLDSIAVTMVLPDAIKMNPASLQGSACQTNSVVYTLTVQSQIPVTQTVTMTWAGNAWPTTVVPASFELDAGDTQDVTVTVSVPGYAFTGDTDAITVTATSNLDPSNPVSSTMTTTAGNQWQGTATTGSPALWPASASDGAQLYYIGGKDDGGVATNALQIFNPLTGFTTGAAVPGPATYGGVAGFYSGKIYFAPGFTAGGAGSTAFMAYDPVANTWTSLAPRPAASGLAAGGVTAGGKFVLVGGSPTLGFVSTAPVAVYDIATDTWSSGSPFTAHGFTASSYTVVGNKAYLLGDLGGSRDFYAYDVVAGTWTALAAPPADAGTLSGLMLAPSASTLYLVGGGLAGALPTVKTFRYTTADNTWHPFADLEGAVLGNGGGVLGGVLFTFGGGAAFNAALSPAPSMYSLQVCGDLQTATLTGTVTNGVTSQPIAGALVTAVGTGLLLGNAVTAAPTPSATTGPDGVYTLTLYAPATYTITATFDGFDPKSASVSVAYPGPTTQNFVMGPPAVTFQPTSFDVTLPWATTDTRTLAVNNVGFSGLTFDLKTSQICPVVELGAPTQPVKTSPVSDSAKGMAASAGARPSRSEIRTTPDYDVNLVWDDGSLEDALILRDPVTLIEFPALVLNHFPQASITVWPFKLDRIEFFADPLQNVAVGQQIRLVAYSDPDGGSMANAILKGSEVSTIQTGSGWNTYDLTTPIIFDTPGDVIIGFETMYAEGGTTPWPGNRYPYPMDTTAPKGHSYLGWMAAPADPLNYSDLGSLANLTEMGALGFPSNLMVRGYGSPGCGGLSWLTLAPAAGAVPPAGNQPVILTFDASNSARWASTMA